MLLLQARQRRRWRELRLQWVPGRGACGGWYIYCGASTGGHRWLGGLPIQVDGFTAVAVSRPRLLSFLLRRLSILIGEPFG